MQNTGIGMLVKMNSVEKNTTFCTPLLSNILQCICCNKYSLFKVNWLVAGSAILQVLSWLRKDVKRGNGIAAIATMRSGARNVPGSYRGAV